MQVAGGGGVHQDRPGDVAVVLLPRLLLLLPADEVRVEQEIRKDLLEHFGVNIRPKRTEQAIPVVLGIVHDAAHDIALRSKGIAGKAIHQFHELGEVLHGVLFQIAVGRFQPGRGNAVLDFHDSGSFPFFHWKKV